MSNPYAISGVTAVLLTYLNEVFSGKSSIFGGNVTLSAVAPDMIQADLGASGEAVPRVNVFLHQVSLNAGWRNMDLPSVDAGGMTRRTNPPLALDLHYLLTVYGTEDAQAEALLGFAVLFLHENPVLTREAISTAMTNLTISVNSNSTQFVPSIQASGLADQIELIKISPDTLGREEVAWLWTALKADYRPTFPFQASVVLVQSDQPSSFALPVLQRNINVISGGPPQLTGVAPPNRQTAAAPGDQVTLTGSGLAGVTQIVLAYARLNVQVTINPDSVTNTAIKFTIPSSATVPNLAAGIFGVSGAVPAQGTTPAQSTNALPLAVAAKISGVTASPTSVSLTCDPPVWPPQTVSLAMGGTSTNSSSVSVPMAPLTTASSTTPSFAFPTALLAGSYVPCLRVDGVDSPIGVNWGVTPPAYTGQVTIA